MFPDVAGLSDGSTAQIIFAASLTTFLVALVGATVAAARPALLDAGRAGRWALVGGFSALAVAGFGRGSLLWSDGSWIPVPFQLSAVALIGAATLTWRGPRSVRWSLWLALTLLVTAEAVAAVDGLVAANWLRLASSLVLGGVLVVSGRRSIAARFAVALTATLLMAVLAVSVSLSVVIDRTVEGEALKRVGARARAEVDQVTEGALGDAVDSARLAALTIQGTSNAELIALASGISISDGAGRAAAASISDDLRLLADQDLLAADGPILFVAGRRTLVVAQRADQIEAEALVGSLAVESVADGRAVSAATVQVVRNHVLGVGVHRVTARGPDGSLLVGFVVTGRRLGDVYLSERARGDPAVTLAIADAGRVYASAGSDITKVVATRVAQAAAGSAETVTAVSSRLFAAARAVDADSRNPVTVVASVSTTAEGTQASLFRILFGVAAATAMASFALAVALGERIGRGLGGLSRAATKIAAGDLNVRAEVTSPDELGTLGSAFNFMASSVEELAEALKLAAEDEAEIRARLEAVVAGMGEALLAVDAEGRVIIFNGSAENLFGCPSNAVAGQPLSRLSPVIGEDGTDLRSRMASLAEQGWAGSATVVDFSGRAIPVALTAGALRSPQGVVGGVFVLRDMRAERDAERAKAELLANVSHELRTPLVPIQGYARMLLHRGFDLETATEALRSIVDGADRLEAAVDRLIAIADEGTSPSRVYEPVDLAGVATGVVERWRARTDESHQVEMTRPANEGEALVNGDGAELDRALDELVGNAVKFSPGGGRVVVTVGGREPQAPRVPLKDGADEAEAPKKGLVAVSGWVTVSVSDEGIGIPTDRLDALFESFTQADSSATREFGGLGLGLALVRRIVAAHGGEMRCAATLGEGSTFTLVLPAVLPPPSGPKDLGGRHHDGVPDFPVTTEYARQVEKRSARRGTEPAGDPDSDHGG